MFKICLEVTSGEKAGNILTCSILLGIMDTNTIDCHRINLGAEKRNLPLQVR